MHILVTGFEPFGNDSINASGEVVHRLPASIGAHQITTAILPVTFGSSGPALEQLITEHQPEAVICLGEAGGRDAITPESQGVNMDDARIPDNDGDQPRSSPIDPAAPAVRPATIDPNAVVQTLIRQGFNAAVSDDAGRFVCNHIAFIAYGSGVPALFIHVPAVRPEGAHALVGAETDGSTTQSSWSFEQLAEALKTALAGL